VCACHGMCVCARVRPSVRGRRCALSDTSKGPSGVWTRTCLAFSDLSTSSICAGERGGGDGEFSQKLRDKPSIYGVRLRRRSSGRGAAARLRTNAHKCPAHTHVCRAHTRTRAYPSRRANALQASERTAGERMPSRRAPAPCRAFARVYTHARTHARTHAPAASAAGSPAAAPPSPPALPRRHLLLHRRCRRHRRGRRG
jgi:hypothetical protein